MWGVQVCDSLMSVGRVTEDHVITSHAARGYASILNKCSDGECALL